MNVVWGGEVGSHLTGTVDILNSAITFPTCRGEGVEIVVVVVVESYSFLRIIIVVVVDSL